MINICIPTLNAYEELAKCVASINNSTREDIHIHIIDNGGRMPHIEGDNISVMKPPANLGVAGSWNWFIDNVSEPRIICNDDVQFHPEAIDRIVAAYDEDYLIFPTAVGNSNSFSCFMLPDKVVQSVGKFDEWISPKYGYFEDNDYHRRMKLAGFDIKPCDAVIDHVGSSTLKNFSREKKEEHHEKFKLARDHYKKKWGGLPGEEKYDSPFGRKQ